MDKGTSPHIIRGDYEPFTPRGLMPQEILVNVERANRVFGALLQAWRAKLPPYDQVVPVQGPQVLPKSLELGSVDHARFLFSTCYYMKGKINSATAILSLSRLYDTDRWMFEPDTYVERKREAVVRACIQKTLTKGGLGFNAVETSRSWFYNEHKLALNWKGDPSQFYHSASNYEELCQILFRRSKTTSTDPHGFFGFRHKMASMYTYFLEDACIIEPFPYPVPVDFHILRVLVSNEILSVNEMIPGTKLSIDLLSKSARALTLEYCERENVRALELADALWHLSREFCKNSPSNSSSVSKEYKARKTEIRVRPVSWTHTQNKRAMQTCGRCSIAETCKWAIPSSNYYIQGLVHIRGIREKALDLFSR